MKPTKTKSQASKEIDRQMQEYLAQGGNVEALEPGVSGRDANQALPVSFTQPKVTRTPLLEEAQALDARKHKSEPKTTIAKKPKRVLLRDDFGEPVRWVWQDQ